MDNLLKHVKHTIEAQRMLDFGDTVLVGLSGGADSVCLTDVLLRLAPDMNLNIVCAHLNHMLRGADAERDERFASDFCAARGLQCHTRRVNITEAASSQHISTEEAGRDARYEFFRDIAREIGATKIALAHNLNDSAETVLMNLCRGTGLKGLTGIPPVRKAEGVFLHAHFIIRPLIGISKPDILEYISERGLSFVQDDSNADDTYTRNRVRNDILPALESAINPKTLKNIVATAGLLNEDEAFLQQLADHAYDELVSSDPIGVNASGLSALPRPVSVRLIKRILEEQHASRDVTREHLDRVLRLCVAQNGKRVTLPGGCGFTKAYENICFYRDRARENGGFCHTLSIGDCIYCTEIDKTVGVFVQKINSDGKIPILCTKKFCCDKIRNHSVELRTRRPSDKINILHIGTVKLSDYFINRKIPAHMRDGIPLIATGNTVLWILDGSGIANAQYECHDETCNSDSCMYINIWS